MNRRGSIATVALVLIILAAEVPSHSANYYRQQKEVVALNGAVASADDRATEVGLDVLKKGGNAVDAAVTIAFLMAVYEPYNSGVGGHGGQMALYLAKTGEYLAIDSSTRAPAKARPDMFEVIGTPPDNPGDNWRVKVKDQANDVGFRAMFAPSTVAGYWYLVKHYGTLPWQEIIAPAIKVAEEGFIADELYVRAVHGNAASLAQFEGSAEMYMPGGREPKVGDRIIFKDLASTLKAIADGGVDAFYKGPIADKIVDYVQHHGGILTKEDFTSYEVEVSPLVASQYRGYTILTYPQGSNGSAIAEALNVLGSFELAKMPFDSVQAVHTFIEALNLAFIDRYEYVGDRDFVPVPFDGLMAWGYGRERAKLIDASRAQIFPPGNPWKYDANGRKLFDQEKKGPSNQNSKYRPAGQEDTTFMCAADKQGNLLLLTTSNQSSFGSKVTVPGLGITLNSSMNNMNPIPGHPLSIAPFKRVLRNSGPVIVVKGNKPYMIVSAPGGRPIISAILRTLTNVLDYGMGIQAAIDAPRIHSEANLYEVQMESRIPADVRATLTQMGHQIVVTDPYSTNFALVQGIIIDPDSKLIFAGSDPRTHGGARGY